MITGCSTSAGLTQNFPPALTALKNCWNAFATVAAHPAGEAGSSLKLAHNFYGVGIRYHTRRMARREFVQCHAEGAGGRTAVPQARPVQGRRQPTPPAQLGGASGGRWARRSRSRPASPCFRASSAARSANAFRRISRWSAPSAAGNGAAGRARGDVPPDLRLGSRCDGGHRRLGHQGNRRWQVGPVFDAFSSVACQQFMLMPYYFAMFHQNRERHLLPRSPGTGKS